MNEELTTNWDTHWKWEWFKTNGYSPPTFRDGYAGLSCRYYDQILKTFACRSLLDCTCGCGPKSIVLADMGYEVTGTDISPFAVAKAKELSQRLGKRIPFHVASWGEVASRVSGMFDCIVNDALAWAETREDLESACRSFAQVLKSGGIVIFAGADEWNGRGAEGRQQCREYVARTLVAYSLQGPFQRDSVRMAQVIVKRLMPDYVEVTNLYVVEEHGKTTLEYDCLQESFRWRWEDFTEIFAAAHFSTLHSHKVVVDGKERILNVAIK